MKGFDPLQMLTTVCVCVCVCVCIYVPIYLCVCVCVFLNDTNDKLCGNPVVAKHQDVTTTDAGRAAALPSFTKGQPADIL